MAKIDVFLANLVIESPGGFRTELADDRDGRVMTASIGIAVYPNDGWTKESLISVADIILYKIKSRGCTVAPSRE